MKLILLKNAVGKAEEAVREALRLTADVSRDPRYQLDGMERLRQNLQNLLEELEQAIPPDVRSGAQKEIQRLSEPQFGWCFECGAEWVARRGIPREPASACTVCKAPSEARVTEKPENPPRKDFRQNPLMDFLDELTKPQ